MSEKKQTTHLAQSKFYPHQPPSTGSHARSHFITARDGGGAITSCGDDQGHFAFEQEKEKDRTCPRCGKVLTTRVALHKHLNKVFLCDRKGERRYKEEMRQLNGANHCKKCGKNFTTAAGLRYHWAKVTPVTRQSCRRRSPPRRRPSPRGNSSSVPSARQRSQARRTSDCI